MTEEELQGQDSILDGLDQLYMDDELPPPPLLPPPPTPSHMPITCTRWYYEKDIERSTEFELTYHTIRRKEARPMTIDSRSKYVRWNIPVPQSGTTYLDIVLGVKVRDVQFKSIESVVLTVEQFIGRRVYSRCEVITPQELERLSSNATTLASKAHVADSSTEKDTDSGITKWRLKEQLLQSEGVFHAAIEVKTWEGANPDYGTIEIHFVETHNDAFRFYQHDPTYKEHQPYVFSVDVNNTGYPEIDRLMEKPNFVDSYVFSREGAHLAIDVLSKSGRFVVLWQIRELPASDPRCIFQQLNKSTTNERHNKHDGKDFCPKIVAWLYFSKTEEEEASSVDLALSCNGTQIAILDKIRLNEDVVDRDKEDNECCTAVYRFTPESVATGVFPTEAAAGSRFVRVDVADTCPNLVDFAGRAEFHVVAAKDPDPKDELLVACDGVSIEIYSVFGVWSHVRTIILDPAKDMRSFRRNVYAALFKQLRGKHLVLANAQGSMVSTWNIETGEEVSSCKRFGRLEMWALSHVANVSRDGLLITIPGKDHIGIYETTTWNVVGWYRFPGVGHREYVGEGLFIRDDTQIMVAIESDEQPLYRRNRGYIIDIETLEVVDEFISSGTDIFRALPTKGHIEDQVLLLGVGNSTAYGFRLGDRVVFPPRPINNDDRDF